MPRKFNLSTREEQAGLPQAVGHGDGKRVHGQADAEEDTVEDKKGIERHSGHLRKKRSGTAEPYLICPETRHVQLRSCT